MLLFPWQAPVAAQLSGSCTQVNNKVTYKTVGADLLVITNPSKSGGHIQNREDLVVVTERKQS